MLSREVVEILEKMEKGEVKDPEKYVREVVQRFMEGMKKVKTPEDKMMFMNEVKENANVILASIFYMIKPEFREDFSKLMAVVMEVL